MKKISETIILWNFLIIMAGFPIITFLPEIFKIEDTQVFTVPYRIACLISSIVTIIVGVKINAFIKLNYKHKFLYLFFTLYLIRVYYDLYFSDYSGHLNYEYPKKIYYFFWIIGVCILPMISITTILKINLQKLVKYFYILTIFALILALYNNKFSFFESVLERMSGNKALSSISYGHLGVTGFILSIFLLFQSKSKIAIFHYLIASIVSLISIALAGSRSPFLALLVCSFLLLYYLPTANKYSKLFWRIFATCFILLIAFLPNTFLTLIDNVSSVSARRMMETFDTYSNQFSDRDLLYNDAIKDFSESPIIGKHFVLTHGPGAGYYPHNSIIEAFMALGFIGGIIYLFLIYHGIKNTFIIFKWNKEKAWIGLFFIQTLIFSLSSGSLYSGSTLWILLCLLLIRPTDYPINQLKNLNK